MSDRREDMPKMVATIVVSIPKLTLKTGWAYLKLRRRARVVAKELEKGMVDSGMPASVARELAEDYADDLSIKSLMKGAGVPFWGHDK